MMPAVARWCLGLLASGLSCAVPAGAATVPASITCPASITVSQVIDTPIADWASIPSHDSHPWTGVSFSEGPPDQMVWLAPTEEHSSHGVKVATWRLLPSPQGYWVTCNYSGTSATVARQLPAEWSLCEVQFDPNFSANVVKKWHCAKQR